MGLVLPKRKFFVPAAPPLIRPRRWLPDVRRRIVPAKSAVVFDAAGTNQKATVLGTTGISYTGLTISAGLTNGALVVLLASDVLVSSVSVIWDPSPGTNQTLTALGSTVNNVINEVLAFGLVAPTSGNKTLKVTWNAVTAEMYIGAASWSGVNQTGGTTSFPHYNGTNGVSAAPSIAITSATGNAVMAAIVDANTVTSTSGSPNASTELWAHDNSGPNVSVGMFRAAGATTETMSGVLGASTDWTIAGVDILASVAVVSGVQRDVAGYVENEW